MKRMLLGLVTLWIGLCMAGGVSVKVDSITLPTYTPGGYDKTPVFYTGRVYQGAQGRVYPYPMQDVLFDEKHDEKYQYLTMENDWLTFGVLPEHGGHLLNLTDKQTGFETFYRQHVIKPALIGMLGAWTSGGVEWNFPHHHRATTAMPIDWKIEKDRRTGKQVIWVGETELRRRLKWSVGLSMSEDRAVLEAENVFMNRGPFIESMLYWANVSVHCGDDYQVLFPPSCHRGYDHHKNYWTAFPIGSCKVVHSGKPAPEHIVDLSWWKNFTEQSRSIFADDPENDWLAGWDHKVNKGTVHISNRHITVGKKFFLWGNFAEARVWEHVLTDKDGPYLELMVGCWSDNQPDYSWIDPYETRRVKQFWFPVKGIGGVKFATLDGAMNLERLAKKNEVLLGFHSTRVLKNCTVELSAAGKIVFKEAAVAINPNKPWCKTVNVEETVKNHELTGCLRDEAGKVILTYTPEAPKADEPLPVVVENPREPKTYASAEEAYLTGLRLDQFHNGLIDPVPYYNRALEIDESYSPALVALGDRLAKRCDYVQAEALLRKAVARVTRNYTRAKDGEPEYLLGVVLVRHAACTADVVARQTMLKEAEDLLWRATWRATEARQAYVELTRLACMRDDWTEALNCVDEALLRGMGEAKVHVLRAFVLRHLGRAEEASRALRKAYSIDQLDVWNIAERAFLEDDGLEAVVSAAEQRGLKAQQILEVVCEYWGLGAWREVAVMCDQAMQLAEQEKPYRTVGALPLQETLAACNSYKNALFDYFGAYALEQMGQAELAKKRYLKAAAQAVDYCFPNRAEEYAVLLRASECVPETANTWYYLGNVQWNCDQKEAGLASWKRAVACNPNHALALRNVGFGLSHPGTYFTNTGKPAGVPTEEAFGFYEKSLASDPSNFRALTEMDMMAEALGHSASNRLAVLEKYRTTAEGYDPCVFRMASLYNVMRNWQASLKILTGRRFHVWEGGGSLLGPFVEASLMRGIEKMAARDFAGAKADFEQALTYPENLQASAPRDAGVEPRAYYFLAKACAALGDKTGEQRALQAAVAKQAQAGEMSYYRVLAWRALGGHAAEVTADLAALKQAIEKLGAPQAKVVDSTAKFGSAGSAQAQHSQNYWRAKYLNALLARLEGRNDDAKALLQEIVTQHPQQIWAQYWLENEGK